MPGRRTHRRQRRVGRGVAEGLGPSCPQPQRRPRHRHLVPGAAPGLLGREADRPPVVRVDQRPVLGLRPLVDVRDARHRQLDQGRAQHVGPDVRLQRVPEGGDPLTGRPARPGRHEPRHRLLVRRLLLGPARVQARLAHVLQQRPLHPLGRPGRRAEPEHRLPGRPRELRVRHALAGARHLGEHVRPAVRALRQHVQRRPDVRTALGVVRRGHRPGHRPVALHARAVRVELLRRQGGTPRVAAHLGGRQQRHIAVERRVLHGLRPQRRRRLREPRPELHLRGPVAVPPQHQVPYDVHRAGLLRHREGEPGLGRGLLGDHGRRVDGLVGPVDLHAHQQLLERGAQRPGRPVAQRRLRRGRAQPGRHPHQAVRLGRQLVREDLVRRPPHRRLPLPAPVRLGGREAPVLAQQLPEPGRVGEDPVHVPQGVVAGGARDGPGGRQVLAVGQDLLHDRPAAARRLVQPREVAVGVGEPVRVVDAQPVDHALVQQLEDLVVGGLEDLGVLHPHPDELGDAEEAPVVELGAGQPPPHGPVPLRVQQMRQRQVLGALAQREDVVVVAQHVTVDAQLVEHVAQRPAQDRQQQLAVLGLPVDVEPARVRRLRPLAQHLPQGAVVARGHGHVVRDDVHHQAEPVLARGARQRPQPLLAAQLLAHARVVDDVVAVRRARHGLQDGGQVQVRDAERGQVRHDGRGCSERELGLQLQPVRGRGHHRVRSLRCHGDVRTRPAAVRVIPRARCAARRPDEWLFPDDAAAARPLGGHPLRTAGVATRAAGAPSGSGPSG